MQVLTLSLLLVLAGYFAYVTKVQSDRLADQAIALAKQNRATLGSLIDWVTCQSAIPLDKRTPKRLDKCFDILREAGIPINVPDLDSDGDPVPQPTASPTVSAAAYVGVESSGEEVSHARRGIHRPLRSPVPDRSHRGRSGRVPAQVAPGSRRVPGGTRLVLPDRLRGTT